MMAILGCSQDELNGVLKALGYRLERRPVTPQPGDAVPAASEPVPADAAAQSTAPEPQGHSASPESAGEAETGSAEPVYEEIWRPRRRPERRNRARTSGDGKPTHAQQTRAQDARTSGDGAKAKASGRKPRPAHAKPKDKPKAASGNNRRQQATDPDSPFAALKDLKEKMERDMQERA
jgi:ATP-dependent RNA helicase SUPV3L1/SUV3